MLEAVPDWAEDASAVRARMLRILSLVAARHRTCGEPELQTLNPSLAQDLLDPIHGQDLGPEVCLWACLHQVASYASAVWARMLGRVPYGSQRSYA